MIPNTLFITGTDTEIGKTTISCLLLNYFKRLGYTTAALKPIASGCETKTNGLLFNDDASKLMRAATLDLPYHIVNPYTFEDPIAPHIAAAKTNQMITVQQVQQAISHVQTNYSIDILLIEGVGGWAVPLNDYQSYSTIVINLKLSIILVVGMRLGCLNHALLTYQSIIAQGGHLIGWVANCLDDTMLVQGENIKTLKQRLPIPCLGVVPFCCQEMLFDFSESSLFQGGIT
jgi:dethiobiotin synthetase